MLKIEGNKISMNKGDRATIRIKGNDIFNLGDKLKFSLIERNKYNEVVLEKILTITEETDTCFLTFTEIDTKIIDIMSGKRVFNYEIKYNDMLVVIGANEKDENIFTIYPEVVKVGE